MQKLSLVKSGLHKIKWVKVANMYCKTWFEFNKDGKPTQKQRWFSLDENGNEI